MRFVILTVILLLLVHAGCTNQKPSTTIDAIEQSGQLGGIERVTLNSDGSVTLIEAKWPGMMLDSSGTVVDSVNLVVGQACTLSDGYHVAITYELKSIKGNKLTFMVIDRFDARAFGDKIKVSRKKITILPYEKRIDLK